MSAFNPITIYEQTSDFTYTFKQTVEYMLNKINANHLMFALIHDCTIEVVTDIEEKKPQLSYSYMLSDDEYLLIYVGINNNDGTGFSITYYPNGKDAASKALLIEMFLRNDTIRIVYECRSSTIGSSLPKQQLEVKSLKQFLEENFKPITEKLIDLIVR